MISLAGARLDYVDVRRRRLVTSARLHTVNVFTCGRCAPCVDIAARLIPFKGYNP